MLMSEAIGRSVVGTSNAATLGRIDEFVVDPTSHTITALRLKKTDDGDTLRWGDIAAFGPDAVTLHDPAAIVAAPPEVEALSGKAHRLLGKRVLLTTGDEAGVVDDIDFSPESGLITTLILSSGEVPGERLMGIGSYAVVIGAE
jgi:sporulation protein YlmC with PRC-barrel domain